jgi:hypothetical protein
MKCSKMSVRSGNMAAIAALAAMMVAGSSVAADNSATHPPMKRAKFLLLDDRIIDEVSSAELTVEEVKKHPDNPLFGEEKPWEPRFDNMYPSVIYDQQEKLYKCWYSIFIESALENSTPREKRASVKWEISERKGGLCYAVSKDGLLWEKPELGIVDFHGNKRNNIVLDAPHGAGVIHDLRDSDPLKRYKILLPRREATTVWFSADGLDWKLHELPGLDYGDTRNNGFGIPSLASTWPSRATEDRPAARCPGQSLRTS